ncbi:MAG: tetratricopeptide repeat protein, partial [Acidobacteria bacterium]|nr:tetratricopeptide repeat protein [Acidobacteriota bacterium]
MPLQDVDIKFITATSAPGFRKISLALFGSVNFWVFWRLGKVMKRFFSFISLSLFCLQFLILPAHSTGFLLLANARPALAQSHEYQIAPGQTQTHNLTLAAGQFVKLEIGFNGIIAEVRVYDADNHLLINARNRDNPTLPIGAGLLVQTDGLHRLEVHFPAKSGKVATGRYQLWISPPRVATDADRHYISAQQMVSEAERLSEKGTAESRRQALAKFQASLPEWRAANDQRREAEVLYSIVIIKRILSESREALPLAQQVLALTRSIGYQELELQALNGVGKVHYSLSEFEQARAAWNQCLELTRKRGDQNTEVSLLSSLGVVSATLGASQQALAYYQQALTIAREL